MLFRSIADAVLVVHLGFLLFLGTGSLLAWRWPHLVWLHLPSVAWGLVSLTVGLTCPLTVVERHFRQLAGDAYDGGFVDRYLEGVVYPERFTVWLRLLLAVAVVTGYALLLHRTRRLPTPVGGSPVVASRELNQPF